MAAATGLRVARHGAKPVRMGTIFAFDTLAYARKLKAAGVADAQAEAHAEAVRDAVVQGFASKADIQRLEDKIDALADGKADKADVRRPEEKTGSVVQRSNESVEASIADLKATIWLSAFGAAGALFAALRLFGGAP